MSNGDGPTSLGDWIKYLHAAEQDLRQGPKGEHFQEAVEAAGLAARHIHALQTGQQMEDANTPSSSAAGAVTGELLDVLGSGTGEPISGLASLVQGKGFRAGAQEYRDARSTLEEEHPTAANIGVGAGMLGQAALGAGQAVSARGMQAGVPLTLSQIGGTLARGGATAGALGAVGGFSRGGEDPGDIGARFGQAGKDALYSALLGTLLTGVGMAGTRAHLERVADLTQKGNTRALTEQRLANARMQGERMTARTASKATPGIAETSVRPIGNAVDDIQQALDDFRAGKISQEDLNTAMEMAGKTPKAPAGPAQEEVAHPISEGPPGSGLRAGETAQPIPGTEGRGIEITGTRATPAPPSTPTILEMQEGARPGHPVFQGERSFTRSPEVRGGEPLTPSTAGLPQTVSVPLNDPALAAMQLRLMQRYLAEHPEVADAVRSLTSGNPTRGSLP